MRTKLAFLFSLTFLTAVSAAPSGSMAAAPATLSFPGYGFRIQALDSAPGDSLVQSLLMFLPGNQGYVNVQVQPIAASMTDYIAASRKQMEQANFKILNEKNPSATEWTIEYIGILQDNKMRHWYARAIWVNKRVYLATGTLMDDQWLQYCDKIKACVDTFQITPSASTMPPPVFPVAAPAPAADAAAPAPAAK